MDWKKIRTEERNERTAGIDALSTLDMVRLINDEDKKAALAVEQEAEQIAAAVDVIAAQLKEGGRLIYCGCGTSGRLGVLDAVECPPTGCGGRGDRPSGAGTVRLPAQDGDHDAAAGHWGREANAQLDETEGRVAAALERGA